MSKKLPKPYIKIVVTFRKHAPDTNTKLYIFDQQRREFIEIFRNFCLHNYVETSIDYYNDLTYNFNNPTGINFFISVSKQFSIFDYERDFHLMFTDEFKDLLTNSYPLTDKINQGTITDITFER